MKKVFLTGASSGIGRAIAEALLARGDEVWGTSRDPSRLSGFERLHAVALDLAKPESIADAYRSALDEAGYFDAVINNAGSARFGPVEHLSEADLAKEFQILVFGPVQLTRLALADMSTRSAGVIINVTSLASRLPVPFMGAYNAAKAALATLTMSLQLESPHRGVRIVDLQPGDIRTDFNDAVARSGASDSHYEQALAKTWAAVEHNMQSAPKPELVARHVLRAIDDTSTPPRLTVGDAFQAKVAPALLRVLPQRLTLWGIKKYYGI